VLNFETWGGTNQVNKYLMEIAQPNCYGNFQDGTTSGSAGNSKWYMNLSPAPLTEAFFRCRYSTFTTLQNAFANAYSNSSLFGQCLAFALLYLATYAARRWELRRPEDGLDDAEKQAILEEMIRDYHARQMTTQGQALTQPGACRSSTSSPENSPPVAETAGGGGRPSTVERYSYVNPVATSLF
jgi:hypothetical protein